MIEVNCTDEEGIYLLTCIESTRKKLLNYIEEINTRKSEEAKLWVKETKREYEILSNMSDMIKKQLKR